MDVVPGVDVRADGRSIRGAEHRQNQHAHGNGRDVEDVDANPAVA